MRTHVQVIGWLNIVLGGLSLVVGLLGLLGFSALGVASFASGGADALPLLGFFGSIFLMVLLISGLPSVLVGLGLLNYAPWARIVGIVLSILHLLNASTMGASTLLGIYSLIILFHPETERLFRRGY